MSKKTKRIKQRDNRPAGWKDLTKRVTERVNSYDLLTDEQILLKLSKNSHDPEAFLIFGDRYHKSIGKMLSRLFGNNRLARKALQSVLFFVAESAPSYKPNKIRPEEWIAKTAGDGARILYQLIEQHITNPTTLVGPHSPIQQNVPVSRNDVH